MRTNAATIIRITKQAMLVGRCLANLQVFRARRNTRAQIADVTVLYGAFLEEIHRVSGIDSVVYIEVCYFATSVIDDHF